MDKIQVIYDATGNVLLELDGAALELTRAEAEQLFVDLGYALQDMDITEYDENGDTKGQPNVD